MNKNASEIFHRPDLAEAIAKRLLNPGVLEKTSRDGLFITGIRRIGKTTFIRADLIPKLQKEKALVFYVDLWDNQEAGVSPSRRVIEKIQRELGELVGGSTKMTNFTLNLKFMSLPFTPKDVGQVGGVTLADAFAEINARFDINIVLIIDEIQDALNSESGRNLLAALKAARDAVNLRPNNPNGTYLFIVGTGSHRSFVSAMTSRVSQPFYGADRIDFPTLGDDFIEWQIKELEAEGVRRLPNRDALRKGFEILGHRPFTFRQVLRGFQSFEGTEGIDAAFYTACVIQARADADEILSAVSQSDPVTKRIFTEIAQAGPGGCANLFSAVFRDELAKAAQKTGSIGTSAVQSKLNQMMKKDWIFPVTFGSYAACDPQAARVWMESLKDYLA